METTTAEAVTAPSGRTRTRTVGAAVRRWWVVGVGLGVMALAWWSDSSAGYVAGLVLVAVALAVPGCDGAGSWRRSRSPSRWRQGSLVRGWGFARPTDRRAWPSPRRSATAPRSSRPPLTSPCSPRRTPSWRSTDRAPRSGGPTFPGWSPSGRSRAGTSRRGPSRSSSSSRRRPARSCGRGPRAASPTSWPRLPTWSSRARAPARRARAGRARGPASTSPTAPPCGR